MRRDFEIYGVTLIDLNEITNKATIQWIDHCFDLEYTPTKVTERDSINILYHYMIHSICECIISTKSLRPVFVFCHKCEFADESVFDYMKCTYDQLLTIILQLFNKMKRLIPVSFFVYSSGIESFAALLDEGDGRAQYYLTNIRTKADSFRKDTFTFQQIKKFAKKHKLNWLDQEYFGSLRTSALLFN